MQLINFIKKLYYKHKLRMLSSRIEDLKFQRNLHKNIALSSKWSDFCTVKALEINERELKRAISELRRYKKLMKRI